jgi:peptide chain release factor subunit 1
MTALTRDLVRELAEFRPHQGWCLSCFLNLDPGVVPNVAERASHVTSLVDEARRSTSEPGQTLEHERAQSVRADVGRLEDFLEGDIERSGAHGLVVYASGADRFWREIPTPGVIEDCVHVGRWFVIWPLVLALDRDRELVIVAAGRDRGTIWRSRGGTTELVVDLSRDGQGQHDQGGWSQARYARSRDKDALDHLRHVAETLGRTIREGSASLLVIACAQEQRSTFESLLSPHVQRALLGWVTVAPHEAPQAIVEAAQPLLDARLEEARHTELERWRMERGHDGRAAASWEDCLAAAWAGSVESLLVDGTTRAAWACPRCDRGRIEPGRCPIDDVRLERVPGGALELALRGTVVNDGRIVTCRGPALADSGGVGAVLRFPVPHE